MASRPLYILSRIIFDSLALFIVFIPWIVLHAIKKPYIRGFFCDDESIRYPYKDSTVRSAVLTIVGFVVAFILITITETAHHFYGHRDVPPFQISENRFIPYFLVRIYRYFGVFLFGLAVQQTITNIGKYTIGRLRPHFLDVCKPKFNSLNCTYPGATANMFIYVDQYKCEMEEGRTAVESRLSFPSGHSSFSTFCAIYLSLYLQSRLSWNRLPPLKHSIQAFLLYGAVYTCLSRITDHKHHPTDVLTGAILGFFVAAVAALLVTDLFKTKGSFGSTNSKIVRDYTFNNDNNNSLPNNNRSINNSQSYQINDNVVVNLEDVPVRMHVS